MEIKATTIVVRIQQNNKMNDMFTIFLQQILSVRLLLVIIVGDKNVILVLVSNLNK